MHEGIGRHRVIMACNIGKDIDWWVIPFCLSIFDLYKYARRSVDTVIPDPINCCKSYLLYHTLNYWSPQGTFLGLELNRIHNTSVISSGRIMSRVALNQDRGWSGWMWKRSWKLQMGGGFWNSVEIAIIKGIYDVFTNKICGGAYCFNAKKILFKH